MADSARIRATVRLTISEKALKKGRYSERITPVASGRRRLHQLELRGERESVLAVVLNRCDQGRLSKAEIEEGIGYKIAEQLPNDYPAVQNAIAAGGFVDPETELGRSYTEFAARLAGRAPIHPRASSRLKSLLRKLAPAHLPGSVPS